MSVQAVIYKPNEHADEYIVFIEDVKEVGCMLPLIRAFPRVSSHQLYLSSIAVL